MLFKLNSHSAAAITNAGLVAIVIFGVIYTGNIWSLLALFFICTSETDGDKMRNSL